MAHRPSTSTPKRTWFELAAFVALLVTLVALSRIPAHASAVPVGVTAPAATQVAHDVGTLVAAGPLPALPPPLESSAGAWPMIQLGGMALSAFGLVVMLCGRRTVALKCKLGASQLRLILG